MQQLSDVCIDVTYAPQVSTYRICCVKVPLAEVSGQLEGTPCGVSTATNGALSHTSGEPGAAGVEAEAEFVGEVRLVC